VCQLLSSSNVSIFSSRHYSNGRPSSDNVMNVFDRNAKRTQRNRTALLESYDMYDYIKEEIGWRMADRLSDVKRKFDVAVDLGCGRGHIGKHLLLDTVGLLYQCDMADKVLAQSAVSVEVPTVRMIVDEEHLPFRLNSLDLVISSLSLHWVNNLPGTFRQIHSMLKNDGCFIGAMFGGDTLHELRVSLQLAELERLGGFAAHISPFTSAQDLGSLLTRSGYVMLTIDVDEIIVNYPSMFELMHDLKGMGENNCAWSRQPMIRRDILTAASAIYKERYGDDKNGGVPAMFQILHFIAWKPDPSQRKVAERGSGQVSMKDIDKLTELSQQMDKLKTESKQTESSPEEKERTERTIAELQNAIDKARRQSEKGPAREGRAREGRVREGDVSDSDEKKT